MNDTTDRFEALLERVDRLIEGMMPAAAAPPDCEHYLAFRWERTGERGRLAPVMNPHLFELNELVGIDDIKEEVVRNTTQFVEGLPANNVLLWGERGCGKSSLVKGLLKPFASRGLRIVELKRWDIMSLPHITSLLRDAPYRFLLFCDDLSFDEGEGDFRALKTLLDGDIEERPGNVLIYATSNRRHLMPERMEDNTGDLEIHPEEAVGEKLALADRFGLSFGFYSLDQDEYLDVVRYYAAHRGLRMEDEELCALAVKWSLYSARRSGRSARQFVDDLEGRLGLTKNGRRKKSSL
ncbi:ATP-binding protein [Oryzomonas japonica]|uniref:ATP-binding protein n=1 Tax=Oryzomonas japonica TaxID=2603858 RepID=A0A7J4ZPR5_9BACT|nr:ATP-binding protein [Oryzomonas japonica]KAB0664855.1 ATP-binding protein [Oryzomonas japonica]